MARHALKLECSEADKEALIAITRSRTQEVRTGERARIVLACLDGKENQQVAQDLDVSVPTVRKWRKRFSRRGLQGLMDEPRSGKPISYGVEFRDRLLAQIEQPPPRGMSQWDGPALAATLGASVHAVWRVLRREGIYLERLRSGCVSTDQEFARKAADIVGLYLDPPLNAIVLSLDEKPSIQAIERATGYVETDRGAVVRALKSTYKRHGTLNRFAALDAGTGHVRAQTTESKKRADFQAFLESVLAELPPDKEIHVILDNYCTHQRHEQWLAKYGGRVVFHFTPTSASWLNQIEIVFGLLQRQTLSGASFRTKSERREAIEAFIERHNGKAKPFRWRKREVKGSQLCNTIINLCN